MRRKKSNRVTRGRVGRNLPVLFYYNTHEKACETTTFVLSAQPEISIGLSVLWVSVRVMRSFSSVFYHPLLIDVNSGLNCKSQLNSCLSRVAISLSLSSTVGIAIGHMYYFLEDVFPNKPGGFKIIRTPAFM